MGQRVLMKGNEAIAEAAIKAGCLFFFGYPITPQNELPEYMSRRMPEVGGTFVQAESEVAAINMVYGAAGAGARVMTSSSSPGISLKQEGISYMAGAELPAVIVNIVRGGPGLGSIQPGQGDYFQSVKGGGHGDYKLVVLAPANLQEAVDLVTEAFDIADQYRNPVLILGDGLLGQMMEPVEFRPLPERSLPPKDWATNGLRNHRGHKNVVNSLVLQAVGLEAHNVHLQAKYARIKDAEQKAELLYCDDAEVVVVAYGSTARIAKTAILELREKGHKVGLLRPITLWPFPENAFNAIIPTVKTFLCLEMSAGQMVEDVRLVINGRRPVEFYGRMGGIVPTPEEIAARILESMGVTSNG
ncbi:MAG: 3-methyl-2-oxobutanoate dehydrogenase subunit VorB [Firmicutes bacterium]|nr:3-methyl-2-oxobutanoate dehydrogenase subunit VorB [Dethiobacter sp.]MBS3889323.1 3-methyl-2-oxobutanoate dehydrogenase subunit VorB [Bacillota bacterium]MBS4055006.1 3-methyl-2-oxobutanoate dehydrogenase subunit VorB [Thermaerobacter sp.]